MLIEKNYYLNKSARDAYRSYLLSYASHSHKDIFNVHELDLQGKIPFYNVSPNLTAYAILQYALPSSIDFSMYFLTWPILSVITTQMMRCVDTRLDIIHTYSINQRDDAIIHFFPSLSPSPSPSLLRLFSISLSLPFPLSFYPSGVGKAFGFSVPPRVDLNFSARGDKKAATSRTNQSRRVEGSEGAQQGGRKDFGSSGHAFSADNPYGKKAAGDKRQFSR